jgi:hypothetical protein
MEPLSLWLYVVAAMRLLSFVIGYYKPETFADQLFPAAPRTEVSHLAGRTFGIWTLVTCTLCVLTARDGVDPGSAIFLATFLSFVYALGFFIVEMFYFHTMTTRSILSPGVVASISVAWMGSLFL